VSEKNLVGREEFEVTQLMVQKVLEENEELKSRIDLLEKKLKKKI